MFKLIANKRAQVAIEFVILVSIAFFIFILFVSVTRNKAIELFEEKKYEELKEVGNMIKDELIIASQVNDGYYREIEVPYNIQGSYDYEIERIGNSIYLYLDENQYYVRIPSFLGNISKGKNLITKEGGDIYVS